MIYFGKVMKVEYPHSYLVLLNYKTKKTFTSSKGHTMNMFGTLRRIMLKFRNMFDIHQEYIFSFRFRVVTKSKGMKNNIEVFMSITRSPRKGTLGSAQRELKVWP